VPLLQSASGLAILLAAGLAVYLLALTLSSLHRLRRPPRRTYAWAVARGVPGDPSEMDGGGRAYETWSFDRAGLEFEVWDVPGDDPGGPVVLATHGWGGSRVDMLPRLAGLLPHASRVVLWDMPGHGESRGVCRLGAREALDLAALIDLLGGGSASDRPLVLYGFSLGAEVSLLARAARPDRVSALVLEAPFRRGITAAWNVHRVVGSPAAVNVPAALALLGLLEGKGPGWRWRDLARLAEPGTPTLVLHGDRDPISPSEDGVAIAEAAGGVYAEIAGAGHTDMWGDGTRPDAEAAVTRFLEKLRVA
jgi:pimeloyl-ACP methyl ester carboxylesterase